MSIQHFKKWDENNYARVKLCLFFVDKQLKQHAFENTHLKNCWLEISTLLEITFESNWNVPHTSFLKLDPWMYQFWEVIWASHSCAIVRTLFKSKDCSNESKISHTKGRQFSTNETETFYKYPSLRSATRKWSFTCGPSALGNAWSIFETCCVSYTFWPTKSKCIYFR